MMEGKANSADQKGGEAALQFNIDVAAAHLLPDGSCLLSLCGWLKTDSLDALVLLEDERPQLLNARYCFRPDVDAAYGPCRDPRRIGHGFVSVCRVQPKSRLRVCAAVNGAVSLLGDINARPANNLNGFLGKVDAMGLDMQTRDWLYRELSRAFREQAPAGANVKIARDSCGDQPGNPESSLIIAFDGDEELLVTQLMGLLEDRLPEMEIIYVGYGAAKKFLPGVVSRFSRRNRFPVSWIIPNGEVDRIQAMNIGAAQAKGKMLAFMDGSAVSDKHSGASRLVQYMRDIPGSALCGCGASDIFGQRLNSVFTVSFDDELNGMVKISLPDRANAGKTNLPKGYYIEPRLFLTTAEAFNTAGGFSAAYFDAAAAIADYCETLRSLDRHVIYAPEFNIASLRSGDAGNAFTRMHDGAVFREKWAPAKYPFSLATGSGGA